MKRHCWRTTVAIAAMTVSAGGADPAQANIDTAVEIPTSLVVQNFGSDDYAFNLPSGTLGDPDIKLVRGNTYTFTLNVPPNHPFYIKDAATDLDAVGVTGQGSSNGQQVVIEVTDATPDLLYYVCNIHDEMRGNIYVLDAPPEVAAKVIPTPIWALSTVGGLLVWLGVAARKRRGN